MRNEGIATLHDGIVTERGDYVVMTDLCGKFPGLTPNTETSSLALHTMEGLLSGKRRMVYGGS